MTRLVEGNAVAAPGPPLDAHLAAVLAGGAGDVLVEVRSDAGDLLGSAALGRAGRARALEHVSAQLLAWCARDAVSGDGALARGGQGTGRTWLIGVLDGIAEYSGGRRDWSVDVALCEGGEITAGAVALPGLGLVLTTDSPVPPYPRDARLRVAVGRYGGSARVRAVATRSSARLVPVGSVGYRIAAVVRGEADASLDEGPQPAWYTAAGIAIARAAGLHVSSFDGAAVDPCGAAVSTLLVCRPELAEDLVRALR